MLSSWEHAESHKLFSNLSELTQKLVYFITLCLGGPCTDDIRVANNAKKQLKVKKRNYLMKSNYRVVASSNMLY